MKIKARLLLLCCSSVLMAVWIAHILFKTFHVDRQYVDDIIVCDLKKDGAASTSEEACPNRWIRKTTQGKVIFDVLISKDPYGRRHTPGGIAPNRKDMIIFFGCSYTLGTAVNNNETYPYYFSRLSPTYNVFNYGIGGGGPNDMLEMLLNPDITKQLPLQSGKKIAIYQFMSAHVQRAIGAPSAYLNTKRSSPYFVISPKGDIEKRGHFYPDRFMSHVFDMLGKVPFLKYIMERSFSHVDQDDVAFATRLVEKSRDQFRLKFGSSDFFVLIYPGDEEVNLQFISQLQKAKIKYFDYSKSVDMSAPGSRVGDGHPSPRTHEIVAQKLFKDLKKY